MDINAEESQEHARLLNQFVQAQERYKSLLPRPVAVGAGQRSPSTAPDDKFLALVQEADRERLVARDALYRFRSQHGMA